MWVCAGRFGVGLGVWGRIVDQMFQDTASVLALWISQEDQRGVGVLLTKVKEQQSLPLDRRGGCFTIFVVAEWPYVCLIPNMVMGQPCLDIVSTL